MIRALEERRPAVEDRWAALILDTYPDQSGQLFAKVKDRFRNPVGTTIRRSVGVLVGGLLGRETPDEVDRALGDLVRLRAVQDFTPAQAVGFIFQLKRALREELPAPDGEDGHSSLADLHQRIDDLALRAFDQFMECRERIYQIRAREAVSRTYSLLRQAGAVVDLDESPGGPEKPPDNTSPLKGGCEA